MSSAIAKKKCILSSYINISFFLLLLAVTLTRPIRLDFEKKSALWNVVSVWSSEISEVSHCDIVKSPSAGCQADMSSQQESPHVLKKDEWPAPAWCLAACVEEGGPLGPYCAQIDVYYDH